MSTIRHSGDVSCCHNYDLLWTLHKEKPKGSVYHKSFLLCSVYSVSPPNPLPQQQSSIHLSKTQANKSKIHKAIPLQRCINRFQFDHELTNHKPRLPSASRRICLCECLPAICMNTTFKGYQYKGKPVQNIVNLEFMSSPSHHLLTS